ncbi:DUF4278 domain-containing protein [Kovacikia minuta CCNUW1]|uniref:DUF4278 domain-containing protein n=1 Tax=Kovacikia minuta TaxID=2931930 RepID=UPI001CCE3AFE|nr:DUF4278 domain-containing protein [Kovacikia minuta]UBF23720.1 DUF4278 domain-containing protein [Kovacikia minuta CCNUW1]
MIGTRWLVDQNPLHSLPQEVGELQPPTSSVGQTNQPSQQPSQETSLSYRGVAYNQSKATEAIATDRKEELTGKYRGGVWKKSPDAAEPSPETGKTEISGKYRGCTWKSPN